MCVRDTRRRVYVYRKGRWGLCMCMLVRGRVLVIKVSENSCKWLREGGRVISKVSNHGLRHLAAGSVPTLQPLSPAIAAAKPFRGYSLVHVYHTYILIHVHIFLKKQRIFCRKKRILNINSNITSTEEICSSSTDK